VNVTRAPTFLMVIGDFSVNWASGDEKIEICDGREGRSVERYVLSVTLPLITSHFHGVI